MAGVQVGDQIERVVKAGGEKSAEHVGSLDLAGVEAALGDLRPTANVEMQLIRYGKPMTATAQLVPRGARTEL
jgi:hypothetical protein